MATKVASAEWTEATTQRLNKLVEIGMPKDIATSLITHCKATAKDPVHCIKIGASILGAESSLGNRCYKNNCFWILAWKISYDNKDVGVKEWVSKYNKWWYKQKNPDWFYSTRWNLPITRYCTSEESSWTKVGCPNGNKNAWKVWNQLSNF